jgi:hypothetical protein
VVEGARLESVYRRKPIGGSNPPLSAIKWQVCRRQNRHFMALFEADKLVRDERRMRRRALAKISRPFIPITMM